MANEPTTDSGPPTKAPAKPLPFLFVFNNGNGHRILTLRGSVSSVSKTLVPGGQIKLIVGSNVVERRLWDQWKAQNQDGEIDGVGFEGQASILLTGLIPRTVNHLDNEGKPWLEEGPGVASRDTPLANLNEKDARKVIAETLDEPTLKRWLQVEKRDAIASVLAKRVEEFRRAESAGVAGSRVAG